MIKTIKILALLVLSLSLQQTVMSQDNSALLAQIESSIAKKDPKWKLARKGGTKKGDYVSFAWKTGKSTVSVFIAFYGTTDKATNGLKNLPGLFEDSGLKMTILPATIPNLGDENYTWEDGFDKRFKGVAFRKDKVVVKVDAPSIEIAQRFASHVAEVITADTSVTERQSKPDRAGSYGVSGPKLGARPATLQFDSHANFIATPANLSLFKSDGIHASLFALTKK